MQIWKLSNILLNNQWSIEEIKEELKKYLETNENENVMIQSLWDAAKAVVRVKFTATQAYLRNQRKIPTSLNSHLKQGEKEQMKPKIYGMQEKQFYKGRLSYTNLPQETRKISNKQSTLISKGTRRTHKT